MTTARDAGRLLAPQRERIAELERLALTDELTGLLNRRAIEAEMEHALSAARRYDERGVLVIMDTDGFKAINDTYGHAVGDEVLRQVARVLQDNVRDTDRGRDVLAEWEERLAFEQKYLGEWDETAMRTMSIVTLFRRLDPPSRLVAA